MWRHCRRSDDRNVAGDTGIYPGEALAIMEALVDIHAEVRYIRELLEDDDEPEETTDS